MSRYMGRVQLYPLDPGARHGVVSVRIGNSYRLRQVCCCANLMPHRVRHPTLLVRKTTMRITRPIAAAAAAALTVGVLAGCANPLEQLAQQGAEKLVEDTIERETGVDIDADGEGGAAVPGDFPAELPLPDGAPTAALKVDKVWSLSYSIDDPAEAEALAGWYAENGYEELLSSDQGELRGWAYENEVYAISISALVGDGVQLHYAVTAK